MSKIGIMTFYNEKNFGAQLQAYALQSAIGMLGHKSEFVRYCEPKKELSPKNRHSYLKSLKSVHYSLKNYILVRRNGDKTIALFDDFVERYLNVGRNSYYSLDSLKECDEEYDGFIAGSDMVWSDIGQNLDAYFLTFTSKDKRLSYAPSLTGRDSETQDEAIKYKNWLEGIKCLSCREQYGVDYIKRSTGREAELVVDPTLLLDKEEWKKRLSLKEDISDPYVLCYMFNGESSLINKNIERFARDNNYKIKYIPMCPDDILHDVRQGIVPAYGPKEFVELFLNASFVFTNSFHGLLFSIIMNKPFYLIHRGRGNEWRKHEERMNNILDQIGLQNRFVYSEEINGNIDSNIDYKNVNDKVSALRKKSLSYLNQMLNGIPEAKTPSSSKAKPNRIDGLSDKKCTGCATCFIVCPTGAISMEKSEEGFLFPKINDDKCIKCGLCAKRCPEITPLELKYPQQTYCGYGNNPMVERSASGGAFVTFAKHIIEKEKGVVYGATLTMPAGICNHIAVDSIENLHLLQNSKYVQSDIRDVLPDCKEKLDKGITVLFSGTPCQIAALRSYLGKDYSNLYVIDIICHGVPSPEFLKKYIANEIDSEVKELRFRHKLDPKVKRSAYDINYELDGKTVIRNGASDLYFGPFIRSESYRECCYNCDYAREERVSDITIGDCDSWKRYIGLEKNNVISSIILNTEKGVKLWRSSNYMFKYLPMNYKEECIINSPLKRPTSRPDRRNTFYKELKVMNWSQYKKKTERGKYLVEIKKIILNIVINQGK